MANQQHLRDLFIKYLDSKSSPDETDELLKEMRSPPNRDLFNQLITEHLDEPLSQELLHDLEITALLSNTRQAVKLRINRRKKSEIRTLWLSGAAASLFIGLYIGFYTHFQKINAGNAVRFSQHDVSPGRNKAILTLADGHKINVDDAASGKIAQQAGVGINKTNNGQIVYQAANVHTASTVNQFNTITTPNGGQYQVVLPDGTKVWLNAASSLYYPVQFSGNNRLVTLTGEAYFEVAHNRKMPFVVQSFNQQIKVLGTHFNVKSYTDEPVVTTLLQGSVAISVSAGKGPKEYLLKPHQEAVNLDEKVRVKPADEKQNTAWIDGQFIFHNTDLSTIMRQVQRWYDVDVDIKALPGKRFNGAIGRDVKLSRLLQLLELTSNLKFEIEGRRIMVIK